MFWPIKVAGKTMSLLDLVEYKNLVQVSGTTVVTLFQQGAPANGHTKATYARALGNAVTYTGYAMNCETKEEYKNSLIAAISDLSLGIATTYNRLGRPEGFFAYCSLIINTKSTTLATHVMPGDKWLDLQKPCTVILPKLLSTEQSARDLLATFVVNIGELLDLANKPAAKTTSLDAKSRILRE